MLILSCKCAEQYRLPVEDVTLNVVEISGQRVRLGMAPASGQTLDLREEGAKEPIVREVEVTERGYRVLVWADLGVGLRINERVQVRVVAVDDESVRLGIVAAPPPGRAACDAAAAPKAPPLSAELLSYWVAKKITAHLEGKPRGAVQELAKAVGVSAVTINRWRKRETKVTGEHLEALLKVLNASLDDVAAELGMKEGGAT